MKQTNYRFFISFLFRILVIVGLLFVITPFIISVFDGSKSLNSGNNQFVTVNLSSLNHGELKKIKVGYNPVWIYKRHKKEINQLSQMTPFLADPLSTDSIQPELCRNQYRSFDAQYFVFTPVESKHACRIRYLNEPDTKLRSLLSAKNVIWFGGFTESCYGSIYDLSGRRYSGTGIKEQKNLTVPEYTITRNSINNSKQQGDVIQFKYNLMVK